MKRFFSLIRFIGLLVGTHSWSKEFSQTFETEHFDSAKKNPDYLKFVVRSTKAGMFTGRCSALFRRYNTNSV